MLNFKFNLNLLNYFVGRSKDNGKRFSKNKKICQEVHSYESKSTSSVPENPGGSQLSFFLLFFIFSY